jgi:hypothetical protein
MTTSKQSAAAKKNVKDAANTAKRKKTIARLPKAVRTAFGKKGQRQLARPSVCFPGTILGWTTRCPTRCDLRCHHYIRGCRLRRNGTDNSYLAGRVNQYESFASYDKAEGLLGSR